MHSLILDVQPSNISQKEMLKSSASLIDWYKWEHGFSFLFSARMLNEPDATEGENQRKTGPDHHECELYLNASQYFDNNEIC